MTTPALDDLLVLDLSASVAAGFSGKILADLGARVVLLEPSEGSALRSHDLFGYLSGGKESVVPGDHAAAAAWLAAADVVLTDGSSPWHQLAVDQRAETTVLIDQSAFGRSGPYAEWESSDLVTWAMGGYLYFTGAPDREPIWLPGPHAQLHSGVHGAFAALVAIFERRTSGLGQAVEISHLDATLTAHAWLVSSWAANGVTLGRVPQDLIQAKDGAVYVMRIVPKDELFVMIERPDMMDENLTADIPTWYANMDRIFAAVAEWAKDKTVAEIVEFGQLLRIAVTPVVTGPEVLEDEQLAFRDWWENDGDIKYPGQPFHFSKTSSQRRGGVPTIGANNGAAPSTSAGTASLPATTTPRTGLPLEGLRIIEVTANWAGPVGGRFIADLGADDIKIEWATRPATRALVWVGPYLDQQRQPWHRAMYFNEMNRNKRGVCVDLSKPDGKAAFLELVKTADILLENNSARVMPNFGLGYDVLKEVNPSLIMVSMSGYGADGPRRDWVAYGANIETTSSLTSITGYPDGQLSRTTLFYADPVSGNFAAVAMMAALHHRERTGEGQWVEMSLNECGVTACVDALVTLQQTGEVRPPMGNRDPRVAPQGVYRAIGTDNWIALTVRSADEWSAVARVIGREDLADDPELATLAGRWARHDELDAAISAWTAGLEQYEITEAFQAAGVPAGPVLANWQIMPDPHIHAREMYETVVFPVVGAYPTTRWPWRFDRTPAAITRPAPLFAQHNKEILEATFDASTIEALYASGATADEPEKPW